MHRWEENLEDFFVLDRCRDFWGVANLSGGGVSYGELLYGSFENIIMTSVSFPYICVYLRISIFFTKNLHDSCDVHPQLASHEFVNFIKLPPRWRDCFSDDLYDRSWFKEISM